MGALLEQKICVKFWSKIGKTASEIHETFTAAFADATRQTQTCKGFSLFKRVETWGRWFVSIQVVPAQVTQTKMWRK